MDTLVAVDLRKEGWSVNDKRIRVKGVSLKMTSDRRENMLANPLGSISKWR
jgi:hypothetical protein